MRRIYWDDVWAWLGMAAIAVFILIILAYVGRGAYVQRHCLQSGYKHGQIDVFMSGYCIKRVDQTDVVVPLNKI